jgi:hypothetical protein
MSLMVVAVSSTTQLRLPNRRAMQGQATTNWKPKILNVRPIPKGHSLGKKEGAS